MTDDLERRFEDLWSSLRTIGLSAESGGYRRFAWTAVDEQLRRWFREQALSRDLTYKVDRNGNQWAWLGVPGEGGIVTGSHLDSVPDGGAYDGPLGIVSAFLAVDELRAGDRAVTRPVAIVNFADEEGARFGVACVGSRLLTGVLTPHAARALTDGQGVTLEEAMTSAGVDIASLGRDDVLLGHIGAFVELHIEQGRALDEVEAPVGVATGIWPHGRWLFAFTGEANHAGTTRLADRRDPMLPFALTVLSARARSAMAGALATFGRVRVVPNATNGIASRVDGWLDLRAPDEGMLATLVQAVTDDAVSAAATNGVTATVTCESSTPAVVFDEELSARVQVALGGVPALSTGAGHDAGILSAHVPAAMLFVRNRSGISHSPAEQLDPADLVAGVRALATVLAELACQ
ncbi:MAG: beta-ureidopropionase / N-carbamoyl-L-amino-acid hydrolase [Frankiaceae bacterium]|nr:beta-ureidopropionase / N-carbamoyl-L-amino-acid hydrolase [Frankiaceae bacterium]